MEFPNRRSIRLKRYDYSQSGYYFVTICSYKRECIFGEIINNKIILNDIGKIIKNNWELLPKRFPIELDEYQIMPNHFHSIIHLVGVQFIEPATSSGAINCQSGAINCAPTGTNNVINHQTRKPTLGQIIRYFKAKSSHSFGMHIWQRNYYEHIVRNEIDFYKIREYIELNPVMWDWDKNNPKNIELLGLIR